MSTITLKPTQYRNLHDGTVNEPPVDFHLVDENLLALMDAKKDYKKDYKFRKWFYSPFDYFFNF